ncbi:uncharacterized protein LOC126791877 isoform X2 [Argentina anserina]|uniref:uncharacterized protein LOC126791877 isoform X2 n=1 Tax=Argentina anserina TaxID=57926 RepID=UPI0021765E9D|nr:uncharacterized protein LOC126791877 isoform X2 [Potentilla anserina]
MGRKAMLVSKLLKKLRLSAMGLGTANSLVLILGTYFMVLSVPSCDRGLRVMLVAVSFLAALRIATMVRTGFAQETTAKAILEKSPHDCSDIGEDSFRPETRVRYKKWLWWTRFAAVILVLQFFGAFYLLFHMIEYMIHSRSKISSYCLLVATSSNIMWKQQLLIFFLITVCLAALLQCFTGFDVLKWRSFYATQDDAWKAHYREIFDNGIREALCCMGRVKYFALEEDEVFSVARLLGDLVAYRAAGRGHLELMAGLALMRNQSQSPKSCDECMEIPEEKIREAADLHKFAEAAYTGPLLDFGRNPFVFPCAWLYRQGILIPWTRNRLPKLDGDNWLRGHAAAFLKYVKLSPAVLRQGRVNQGKCKAAYFVIVLHHLKLVVIAVRGTETPEDLITDSLCRECRLSTEDLDGLIKSTLLHRDIKDSLMSFPHYAHSGIVEAARDLFMQIEGSDSSGLLSSLLGDECECEGYSIRIVGHSLGGAIGALLGLRLCHRYPNLHVYTYGPLPCVDSVVANACSEFITSIVYNNEFSARLSVRSILRLRGAAITAMSQDSEADSATILRLARHFLHVTKHQHDRSEGKDRASDAYCGAITPEELCHQTCRSQFDAEACKEHDQGFISFQDAPFTCVNCGTDDDQFTNPFANDSISNHDPVSEFMKSVRRSDSVSPTDPHELYLPGLVIHIVPQHSNLNLPIWKGWRVQERTQSLCCRQRKLQRYDCVTINVSRPSSLEMSQCMLNLLQAQSSQIRSTEVLPNEPPKV